jgi:hypothetical protein
MEEAMLLQEELSTGNLAPLIPSLNNENLTKLLQSAALEIFVRAPNQEEAERTWSTHSDLVRNIFFVEEANDSEEPEIFTDMLYQREEYTRLVNEGGSETPHSVMRYKEEEDDRPMPGQYL